MDGIGILETGDALNNEVIGWAVAVHDADDGWQFTWDEIVHHDKDRAVRQLREASRRGYFCKLAEVRLVPSDQQPSPEPPTLYQELYAKFVAAGLDHATAVNLAEQADGIVAQREGLT